jgi:thiamine pyrophosphate-dependent acetolactate synthase large subunit-like protein
VVILSDGELNLIKLKQSWKNLSPYGVAVYSGDLCESEYFLGIRVFTVDSDQHLRRAVKTALAMHEPVIINAVVDPEDYRWLIARQ